EARIVNVDNDPYDLSRTVVFPPLADLDKVADRIGIYLDPVFVHHRAVYQYNPRRIFVIFVGEHPAAHQPDVKYVEILRRNATPGSGAVECAISLVMLKDRKRHLKASQQGKGVGGGNSIHSWNRLNVSLSVADQVRNFGCSVETRVIQRHIQRNNVSLVKTTVDGPLRHKSAHQQSRSDEQHKRQ